MSLPITGERTVPGVAAENYWFRRHLIAYRMARRLVHGVVVDAGSGEGFGTALMAKRHRVLGLELDAAVAAHAAGTYPEARFVRADLCRFPLRQASVDAVVGLQVLEHLHCVEGFVTAAARALRPGGIIVVSTPNGRTFPPGNPSHVHEYRPDELRGLLGTAFDEVRLWGVAHASPLALLDRILGEPLQHRLAREGYEAQPLWLRGLLRTVTSRDFRLTDRLYDCLDLFAVAAVR